MQDKAPIDNKLVELPQDDWRIVRVKGQFLVSMHMGNGARWWIKAEVGPTNFPGNA